MKKIKVHIEEHSAINKRFEITVYPYICLNADYDDVNHEEVDAASRVLKKIIKKHWNEGLFQQYYKEEVIKVWEENEYGLQNDYEGEFDEYLKERGLSPS